MILSTAYTTLENPPGLRRLRFPSFISTCQRATQQHKSPSQSKSTGFEDNEAPSGRSRTRTTRCRETKALNGQRSSICPVKPSKVISTPMGCQHIHHIHHNNTPPLNLPHRADDVTYVYHPHFGATLWRLMINMGRHPPSFKGPETQDLEGVAIRPPVFVGAVARFAV